jgi:hypothetical protein
MALNSSNAKAKKQQILHSVSVGFRRFRSLSPDYAASGNPNAGLLCAIAFPIRLPSRSSAALLIDPAAFLRQSTALRIRCVALRRTVDQTL